MKLNCKVYGVLLLICALSFVAFSLLQANHPQLATLLASFGGVGTLWGALYQLARDDALHQKQLDAQRREFQFSLGAASHMANAAFDKHVDFCEKYMAELHNLVSTLYQSPFSEGPWNLAKALTSLRQASAVWLTDKMNEDLEEFEDILRKWGSHGGFIESAAGIDGYAEQRRSAINRYFELFREVLGPNGRGKPRTNPNSTN